MLAILILLTCLLASCGARADLPASVIATLKQYKLPASGLSVFVQDVTADKPLLAVNADEARNPASAIKVLTTFVALDKLGPDYTWTTRAYSNGPIRDGRLQGDLILQGGGDPFLVTEYFWKFLRGLRDRGLQHITGDLIIDNHFFAVEPEDPGAFDGEPLRPYNVTPAALLLNFQTIRFVILPAGNTIRVFADPAPANLEIKNDIKPAEGRCNQRKKSNIRVQVTDQATGGKIRLTGTYPSACGEYEFFSVAAAPEAMIYGVFKSMWQDMGGTIDGGWRSAEQAATGAPLHSLHSRTLAEIIHSINKYSNNVMTRQLLLSLGAERFGPPGTVTKGRNAIADWLAEHNLNFPELVLDNGAGLSRDARISARSLGRLLLAAQQSPLMPEFVASLPLAAVDGTLRRRFRREALAGRMHLKTGTIDHVKAVAGYVLSRAGRTFAVAVLHNQRGVHAGSGTAVENELLRWVFEQ